MIAFLMIVDEILGHGLLELPLAEGNYAIEHSCLLGRTNMQSPPPDADELTQRYAVRFAAEIAEWWLPLRQLP